ncbi:tol-pal system protein YbgF [Mesorhizobium loti]|nr:tol-pal system protein YbgF [Mesorhizobium loti]PLP60051.1 tol-pal system protein YbgF [Mesorhizobium loti]
MHFRTILSGTLAVLLAASVIAPANAAGPVRTTEDGFSFSLPSFGLPGVFGGKEKKSETVQLAQSGSVGLEDQLRQMNGKIEELNFQILQLQEQLRKTQEDNEFRFQQIEQGGGAAPQKKSDAAPGGGSSVAQAPASAAPSAPAAAGAHPSGQTQSASQAPQPGGPGETGDQVGDLIIDSGNGEPGKLIPGEPSKSFGTITVDKNGNVVSAVPPADVPNSASPSQPPAQGGGVVASLPSTNSPDELYRNSYQFVLSGDYGTAEQGFRQHIERYPSDPKAADAHYWLGESLLGQQKYRDAAEVFLAASKDYQKSKKAPDMLLKLGISLMGLKQRDVACATFSEIGKRYPEASGALKERVKQERALASC